MIKLSNYFHRTLQNAVKHIDDNSGADPWTLRVQQLYGGLFDTSLIMQYLLLPVGGIDYERGGVEAHISLIKIEYPVSAPTSPLTWHDILVLCDALATDQSVAEGKLRDFMVFLKRVLPTITPLLPNTAAHTP